MNPVEVSSVRPPYLVDDHVFPLPPPQERHISDDDLIAGHDDWEIQVDLVRHVLGPQLSALVLAPMVEYARNVGSPSAHGLKQ